MTADELTWVYPLRPVEEQAVAAVEATLGVRFPDDYRAFLRRYQGGIPVESYFELNDPHTRGSSVGIFLGVEESLEDDFIPNATDYLSEQIPSGVIPIVIDGGGDYVMLDLRGPSPKVVYWHHERAEPDDFTPLADSFTQFIDLLYKRDRDALT